MSAQEQPTAEDLAKAQFRDDPEAIRIKAQRCRSAGITVLVEMNDSMLSAAREIDRLREDLARYENGRVMLTAENERLRTERDQYKQMAELNKQTIEAMCLDRLAVSRVKRS